MAVVFEKTKGLTDAKLHYCPGCGHGIVHRLVAEVLEEMGESATVRGETFSLEKFADFSNKNKRRDIMKTKFLSVVLSLVMVVAMFACFAVSAGALFGINYKSKNIGRVLRYNLKYGGNSQNMGWKSLVKTGNLMHKEFWFNDIPFKLDPMDTETYKSSKTDFFAVVTNMLTGKAEYKSIYDLKEEKCMEYLRASGSLPFLSKPVVIDGVPYLDGGIADSIPVEKAIAEGYDKIIVILTRHAGYRKEGSIIGGDIFYKQYPKFAESLKSRNDIYNKQSNLIEKVVPYPIFLV